jgi:hypothetical protein
MTRRFSAGVWVNTYDVLRRFVVGKSNEIHGIAR